MNKGLVNRLKPVTVKKNHHQIILSPRVKNLTLRLGKTQNGYSRKVTREETLTKARKIGIAIEKTGVGIILVTNPSLQKRSRKIEASMSQHRLATLGKTFFQCEDYKSRTVVQKAAKKHYFYWSKNHRVNRGIICRCAHILNLARNDGRTPK